MTKKSLPFHCLTFSQTHSCSNTFFFHKISWMKKGFSIFKASLKASFPTTGSLCTYTTHNSIAHGEREAAEIRMRHRTPATVFRSSKQASTANCSSDIPQNTECQFMSYTDRKCPFQFSSPFCPSLFPPSSIHLFCSSCCSFLFFASLSYALLGNGMCVSAVWECVVNGALPCLAFSCYMWSPRMWLSEKQGKTGRQTPAVRAREADSGLAVRVSVLNSCWVDYNMVCSHTWSDGPTETWQLISTIRTVITLYSWCWLVDKWSVLQQRHWYIDVEFTQQVLCGF